MIEAGSDSTASRVANLLQITSVQISRTEDSTGDWATWFEEEIGSEVVLIRPDFFVYDACAAKDVTRM